MDFPDILSKQDRDAWSNAQLHRVGSGGPFRPSVLGNRAVYTGCDISLIFTIDGQPIPIGNIAAISYSIHREKVPVRTLGHTYPRGHTRGSRTIAGTIVLSVFNRYALAANMSKYRFEPDRGKANSPLVDQLSPFDVTITYLNEFGDQSVMRILGVEITDEGQTHSVDDMMIENVFQYVAQDIEVMGLLTEQTSGQFLGSPLNYADLASIEAAIADVDTALGYANQAKDTLAAVWQVFATDYEAVGRQFPTFSEDLIVDKGRYMGSRPPVQAIYSNAYEGEDWFDDILNQISKDILFLQAEIANLEKRKEDLLVQLNTYKLRDNPNDSSNIVPTDRIKPPPGTGA